MKATEISYKGLIFVFLVISILQLGCEPDTITTATEKTETIDSLTNNWYASKRVCQIMYNTTSNKTPVERFKLVHISDAHLSPWSSNNKYTDPSNLKEAVFFANLKKIRINALVATGDNIGNTDKTTYSQAMSYLYAFSTTLFQNNNIPTFACTGNHDSNMLPKDTSCILTKNDIYNTVTLKQNHSFFTDGVQNYFYSDIANPMGGTIRIISLDVIDQEGYKYDTQHYAVFSQKQIDWLCNTALKKDLTSTHSIIVLIHYPFKPYLDGINNYTFNNEFIYPREMIPEIIEAFRSKGKLQKNYVSVFSRSDQLIVNADFSNSKGEFVCYLSGHVHTTAILEVDGLNNINTNLPRQRMIIASNMSPSDNSAKYSSISRNSTETNNSFNIYAIDTKEKKVYVTFFGAYKPSDQPDYKDIQSFNYL